tara:strand:+ start:12977 stop:14125 length:1149 start_codon:yes stop_codon:yes gene_type:complete
MSFFGPLDHYPGILERKSGLIDLQIRNRTPVSGFRLWASTHPHHLYGNRTDAGGGLEGAVPIADNFSRSLLLQGRPGRFLTSQSILTTKGLRFSEEIRGTTRFIFDLADFPALVAGPALPAGTDFDFADTNPDTLIRNDAGSYIDDGFVDGMQVTVTGATNPANDGTYIIAAGGVAAGTLTFTAAAAFVASLNDLTAAVSTSVVGLPLDDQMLFVAVQQERSTLPEVTVDGFTGRANRVKGANDITDQILGPILCIPPASLFTMSKPTLIISGTAPQLGGGAVAMGVAGALPAPDLDLQIPNPLHLILPLPTTSVTVRNTDAVTALRVSFGLGQQIFEIPVLSERTMFGAVKEVCLMSAAAAALTTFSIDANINVGGIAGGF